ncbi:MAG: hypothetical protein IPH80_29850 [Myxococcales bacterium]|nr:hypothetical protein [Myxococcales bacterium]
MPTNSYELIVLGDATAGLVCAALCARRGMRTLVLTDEARPTATRWARLLPTALAVLPGRGAGAAARVVRELGLDHALKRKVRDARITAQVVGPDARIDLLADAAGQAKELVRELPDHAERALAAWDQAAEVARADAAHRRRRVPGRRLLRAPRRGQAGGPRQRGRRRVVAGAGRVTALGRADRPARGGRRRALAPPPLAMARALELWRAGAPELRGDGTGLRELLREKLTAAGGELRGGVAAELVSGWTKLNAVKLDTGEEPGRGPGGLGAAGRRPGAAVRQEAAQAPGRACRRRRAGRLSYAINLVIDAAAVPEGMAPVVLGVVDPAALDLATTRSRSTPPSPTIRAG